MGNASMKLVWIRRSDAAHRLCVPKTQIRTCDGEAHRGLGV